MIGDLFGDFKGKIVGFRVLPDGKIEGTEQGVGKLLGMDAYEMDTGTSTPMPNGILMTERNGLLTTVDGDILQIRINGIGWLTGKGQKSSYRGVSYQTTQSQKLERLNRVVGVWEYELDENGEWTLKIWEWK